ncbi:MFS transporter [Calidithermus timidus]|jgi:MFS family permease|uniref:MFS transporter n=1 Tax=Calidithermus timidus TaxID=307124 RepID=UPI00035F7018|nr:MFS transporter [Calidithermus timidus]
MPPHTAPRRFYGWRIVWALALTTTISYGILYYGFGVLVKPMEAELGWSRAQTSGAYSLGLLISGLMAIPVGYWVDHRGARGLLLLGSLLGSLMLLAWSQVHSLGALYGVWVGMGLAMALVLYEVAFTVVAVWFRRWRHRATFVITMVAGLASTLFVPLETLLVESLGWRSALVVLALIFGLLTLPLHAVVRRRPQDLGQWPDGEPDPGVQLPETSVSARAAFAEASFWWLATAFTLLRLTTAAIGAHGVPLLLERGYSPAFTAAAVGSIGLVQLLGRAFFLPGSQRWSLYHATLGVMFAQALGSLALLLVPGSLGVGAFVLLYGMSNGAGTLARAGLVAELYGSESYGRINGGISLVVSLTQSLGPIGAGLLHGVAGSYDAVLGVLVAASLLAALCVRQVRLSGQALEEAQS